MKAENMREEEAEKGESHYQRLASVKTVVCVELFVLRTEMDKQTLGYYLAQQKHFLTATITRTNNIRTHSLRYILCYSKKMNCLDTD